VITIHQRYRQTERQTTCDRNTALCTKVHRAAKIEFSKFPEIGWNSSEIISSLLNLRSLQTQTSEVYSKNTRKFWPSDPPPVDLSVEDIRSQIAPEWLQNSSTVTMESLSLFRMVPYHRWPPTTSPKWGFHILQDMRMAIISATWSDTLHVWF